MKKEKDKKSQFLAGKIDEKEAEKKIQELEKMILSAKKNLAKTFFQRKKSFQRQRFF